MVCFLRIGRHSKSIDMKKKACGLCKGRFELLISGTPSSSNQERKTPGKFAMYVKENYGSVKKRGNAKHQEVMKILSAEFAEKNKIS